MKAGEEQLPPQHIGRQTDFIHERKFDTVEAAHDAFQAAAGRLLSVSNWDIYAGSGSAKFTLCNNQGQAIDEMAEEGFFISVDMPAPGPNAGNGLEWVMIEEMASEGDVHTAEEYLLMTVRPVPDPHKAAKEIAHFYTDDSTSTFVVRRDGLMLSASVHGRNETPNNNSVDVHDKVRNTAIALLARIGLSGPQWKKLAKGLVEFQEEKGK